MIVEIITDFEITFLGIFGMYFKNNANLLLYITNFLCGEKEILIIIIQKSIYEIIIVNYYVLYKFYMQE